VDVRSTGTRHTKQHSDSMQQERGRRVQVVYLMARSKGILANSSLSTYSLSTYLYDGARGQIQD
jgi:hypothetical protein